MSARITVRLPNGGAEVLGTIADISTERELAAQAAMASKLSMLGEMASGMAHELIQPMTAISLGAELATSVLQSQPTDTATIARTLATIARQSRRAGEIIDQLRLFGRADQGPTGPVRLDAAVRGRADAGGWTTARCLDRIFFRNCSGPATGAGPTGADRTGVR